jgi:hypothetical protein
LLEIKEVISHKNKSYNSRVCTDLSDSKKKIISKKDTLTIESRKKWLLIKNGVVKAE